MPVVIQKNAFVEKMYGEHPELVCECCPCCGSEDIYRCEGSYDYCFVSAGFNTFERKYEWVPYICFDCESVFSAVNRQVYEVHYWQILAFLGVLLAPIWIFLMDRWYDFAGFDVVCGTVEAEISSFSEGFWLVLSIFFGVWSIISGIVVLCEVIVACVEHNLWLDGGFEEISDNRIRVREVEQMEFRKLKAKKKNEER